ncbi:MAG TPA: IPT/TIG domain-containing protein [Geobacteraceae bacterium]|nr:IPT/TIG domain-containing protein [Geobacteraceae bacterium]
MPGRFVAASIILNLMAASVSLGAAGNQKGAQPSAQAKEEHAPPITILSIIPAQGEPEIGVTLYGSGFTEKTTAFLGNTAVKTEVLGPKQLTFDIPKLPPGLYALFLKREDGTTSRTYNFALLPPKPVVYALSPDTMYACSTDRDREVVVSGRNFQERSQLLFDGAAIRGNFLSPASFSFKVPRAGSGLHQVQVKNSEDAISGSQGLFIDSRPEIDSVTVSEENVNYYYLAIGGRNFSQDSTLVVTEDRFQDQAGIQQPDFDVRRLRSGSSSAIDREKVVFVNCSQLMYQRYPYSTTLKSFKVQVVNPGGEESAVVQVSAP